MNPNTLYQLTIEPLPPIPNWTCSIVTISPFQCTAPNTWLTNCADPSTQLDHQLEKNVGYKVHQFIQTMKNTKLLGHKTLWCTNTATSSEERQTRANSVSSHNLHELFQLCNLWRPLKQSLYMFRIVRKKSSNIYSRIGWKSVLKNWTS